MISEEVSKKIRSGAKVKVYEGKSPFEGLVIALASIDKIIATIRKSKDRDDAHAIGGARCTVHGRAYRQRRVWHKAWRSTWSRTT